MQQPIILFNEFTILCSTAAKQALSKSGLHISRKDHKRMSANTHFSRIRDGGGAGRPHPHPPPIIFEGRI